MGEVDTQTQMVRETNPYLNRHTGTDILADRQSDDGNRKEDTDLAGNWCLVKQHILWPEIPSVDCSQYTAGATDCKLTTCVLK